MTLDSLNGGEHLSYWLANTRAKKYSARMLKEQFDVIVCRDKSGKLHKRSAVCTHLGCQVNFNNAEQSWDCPCHGSRFSPDGKILHGPATKELAELTQSSD